MHKPSLLAAALVTVAIGCSDFLAPQHRVDVVLQTDHSAYVATRTSPVLMTGYRFTIIARVENRGDASVFLGLCHLEDTRPAYSIHLADTADKRDGSAYNPNRVDCRTDALLRLRPGEVRIDTIPFVGPWGVSARTGEPSGALDGQMQLRYSVGCGGGNACRKPRGAGLSNVFTVEKGAFTSPASH